MAENGRRIPEQSKCPVDKDIRLRSVKERQNDERQRKLEEIKSQALAAQIFKEQKEHERRRRLEEMRVRDNERRHQVEERKRAINDAERYRLEFIIKRNQDREQRIDTKRRNERSSAVFAFGSSTPRMLDPSDMAVSYWGARRATSIQNIITSVNSSSALTRRQSERDLDTGSKKRATSATGLERTGEGNAPVIPAGCASGYLGRRRTDLVPTIPSKDSISSSHKSLNHSPASSRPSSSLSQQSTNSIASSISVRHRLNVGPRKPRPVSIAVTGVTYENRGESKPPLPKPKKPIQKPSEKVVPKPKAKTPVDGGAKTIVKNTTGKDDSKKLQDKATNGNEKSEVNIVPPTDPKPAVVNGKIESDIVNVPQHKKSDIDIIAEVKLESNTNTTDKVKIEPIEKNVQIDIQFNGTESNLETQIVSNANTKIEGPQSLNAKPVENQPQLMEKTLQPSENLPQIEKPQESTEYTSKPNEKPLPPTDKPLLPTNKPLPPADKPLPPVEKSLPLSDKPLPPVDKPLPPVDKPLPPSEKPLLPAEKADILLQPESENDANNEMTASMIRSRITTEEEAKAALAERRRLIREEAERQAELERLRIEAEAKAELERQQQEEEQLRQLIELQRQTEQERLQEAIREAQKREEEEKIKREEEQRMKIIKEEADKKAREEAERQKAESQERLKIEEKEREARRKRVEAIMLRTRGKNNANLSSQSTDEKNENKSEEIKDVETKVNGTKSEEQENSTTKIAKDIVDNLIPNEIVKNANTVTIESMNTNDSINSNNAWRDNQQYGNFVLNNNS